MDDFYVASLPEIRLLRGVVHLAILGLCAIRQRPSW